MAASDRWPALQVFSLRRDHKPVAQDDVEEMQTPSGYSKPRRAFYNRPFRGWRGTVHMGCISSLVVLFLNLTMICWASTHDTGHGRSVLYYGDCKRVKHTGTVIHLFINILSTILLGASNFGMQCLSAPTREDVDRAHTNGRWVDIGVPSLRNLSQIARSRVWLWLFLVVSSLPLHLFYNSTVYSTTSANEYDVLVGNSSFTSLTPADLLPYADNSTDFTLYDILNRLVERPAMLEKLEPHDCISTYATNFQTKYGTVVVVSRDFNGTNALVESAGMGWIGNTKETDPYGWICEDLNVTFPCSSHLSEVRARANWSVSGYTVDYCLASRESEKCTLEYSLPLAIVVIIANLAKAILLFLTGRILRDSPLLTTGDAVASFIQRPDETSKGKCLLDHTLIRTKAMRPIEQDTLKYTARPRRRWSALSSARWCVYLTLYTLSIIICISLLIYGLVQAGYFSSGSTAAGMFDIGLGGVNPLTMITSGEPWWPHTLIPATLIANTPQLIFTLLYFLSNSILTSMTLASEWNAFSTARRGLRVSTRRPRGPNQRSSRFLSLPYRYGLPLLTLSALLHWLISQSIFLVNIQAYDAWMERDEWDDTMTLGWSPRGIVIATCVGAVLPAALVAVSVRRFKSGMPVAGSCSLAIAAACHPLGMRSSDLGKAGMEFGKLMWGVEGEVEVDADADGDSDGDDNENASGGGKVGHCAFTDQKVGPPLDGVVYR